jgi:hypothetical protein
MARVLIEFGTPGIDYTSVIFVFVVFDSGLLLDVSYIIIYLCANPISELDGNANF